VKPTREPKVAKCETGDGSADPKRISLN